MLNLALFSLFIVLGYYFKSKQGNLINKDLLHKLTWYNLILVALFQFWGNGIELSYLYLIIIGFAIHIIPLSFAIFFKSLPYDWRKHLLAYSTYGGGNRGVLALTLLAPSMLPYFFILDIGIFLSLLLVYPIAVKLFTRQVIEGQHFLSIGAFSPVIITASSIAFGIYLHSASIAITIPEAAFPYLKLSLLILVSMYLGLNFSFRFDSLLYEATKALIVRVFGVFLPVISISYFLLPDDKFSLVLMLTLLAVFLPVSSLAPQLTPTITLREWITAQVISSSVFYVIILFAVSLFKAIYA